MAEPDRTFKLEMTDVDPIDGMPYSKVDEVKACKIANVFGISFYQLNYQAIAEFPRKAEPTASRVANPVAKIVLNRRAFEKLAKMVAQMSTDLREEDAKERSAEGQGGTHG